jgi:ribosomal protein L37AE/L43A
MEVKIKDIIKDEEEAINCNSCHMETFNHVRLIINKVTLHVWLCDKCLRKLQNEKKKS